MPLQGYVSKFIVISARDSFVISNTLRTREKPLLCTPEDAIPMRYISWLQVFPVIRSFCLLRQLRSQPSRIRLPDKILAFLLFRRRSVRRWTGCNRLQRPLTISAIFSGIVLAAGNIVQEETGALPCAGNIIYTHCHAVDSTVSCLSIINASFSFVPTPSVPETRVGFSMFLKAFMEKAPENPPISSRYFRSHCFADVLFH